MAGPVDRRDQSGQRWFGWRIIRVRGRSMVPTLNDGDHVLLKRYGRFRRPKTGDAACICRGDGPTLIKRLGARDEGGRFGLSGDGAASARLSIWATRLNARSSDALF